MCYVDGCDRATLARGLCGLHYKRWRAGKDLTQHNKLEQSLPRGGLVELGLHKHHPFYVAWVNMKTRCDNPRSTSYPYYGGKGVRYCEKWKRFSGFYEDMFPTWSWGLTIDRRDPTGAYTKENCRWTTMDVQLANRGRYA